MRTPKFSFLFALSLSFAVGAVVTAPTVAYAQDDDEDLDEDDVDEVDEGEGEEGEGGNQPADGEALAGTPDVEDKGEANSLGGATGFEIPTGPYMSGDLGGFFRIGGWGDTKDAFERRTKAQLYSNLQPWIALTVGYDFMENLGAEVTLGTGFVSDAATHFGKPESPENFAIYMLNVAATGSYYLPFYKRLAITGKAFIGGTFLAPTPAPDELPLGVQFGLGGGVRWATLLTDVSIGFDVNSYWVVAFGAGPLNVGEAEVGVPLIPAFSFCPVIKYQF